MFQQVHCFLHRTGHKYPICLHILTLYQQTNNTLQNNKAPHSQFSNLVAARLGQIYQLKSGYGRMGSANYSLA